MKYNNTLLSFSLAIALNLSLVAAVVAPLSAHAESAAAAQEEVEKGPHRGFEC